MVGCGCEETISKRDYELKMKIARELESENRFREAHQIYCELYYKVCDRGRHAAVKLSLKVCEIKVKQAAGAYKTFWERTQKVKREEKLGDEK